MVASIKAFLLIIRYSSEFVLSNYHVQAYKDLFISMTETIQTLILVIKQSNH